MEDPFHRPTIAVALFYKDPRAALDWLEKAFGFTRSMVIADGDGNLVHSEMRFDGGLIYIGSEWTDFAASPATVGGKNTHSVHVRVNDVNAHCERARAAGADIVREPQDEFYGDRTYTAKDAEGHIWSFGQMMRVVSREEAEESSGLKIEGWS